MDKNFIIAIILSTLVILLFSTPQYQKKFGRNVPAKKQTTQSETSPAAVTSKSTGQEKSSNDTLAYPAKAKEASLSPGATTPDSINVAASIDSISIEETRTLENDDIRVVLSNRGGVIRQVFMKNFTFGIGDSLVQLVTDGERWFDGRTFTGTFSINHSDILFSCENKGSRDIVFTSTLTNSQKLTKSFSLDEKGYLIHTKTLLEGNRENLVQEVSFLGPVNKTEKEIRTIRIWPFSLMMPDETYTYDTVNFLGQGDKIISSNSKKDKKTRVYTDEGNQKIDAKKDTEGTVAFDGDLEWCAVRNKYFMAAAIPKEKNLWNVVSYYSGSSNGKWYNFIISKNVPEGVVDIDIYAGPIAFDTLEQYGRNLTEIVDLSWKFIRPLAIAFLWLVKKLHAVIPNWGLVIIVFSIIIKIVLYPLSHKSIVSMRKMSKLQPQINALREKYRNNAQKLHQATMELYKKEGVNPFGGCFPILLQMPVFFALYPVIGRTFELRQAMFIPRWIEDLSRPDPFYILPIAMGISMFIQSKDSMTDPNQKAMVYIMPVMMVILFANFSAGLTLYWLLFNILSYIQQKVHKPA